MSDRQGWSEQLARFSEDSPYSPFDEETGTGLERGEPTAAELAVPYAAPGRDADHAIGVLYRADHETLDDGMCRQARTHARALSDAGIPLVLRSIANRVRTLDPITHERVVVLSADDILAPEVYREVGKLRSAVVRQTAVCVNHMVIESARHLWMVLVPDYVQNDPKAVDNLLGASIVYTPWERDRVSRDVIDVLNRVGQVWLQCERNREAFVSSGLDPERVRIVPNASVIPELHRRAPTEARLFYTIGKWEPRKDQHRLIGAFLRSFYPGDAAMLYVKTHEYRQWQSYPSIDDSIAHWLADERVRANGWTADLFKARVLVDTRILTDEDIVGLHHLANIYVSASHGEGWDYPAFDAVATGNRLVHVGFGGSEDYAPASALRIPWKLGPVEPEYGWEMGASWASYTDDELEDALLEATPQCTEVDLTRFAPASVGKLMRQNVDELVARLYPGLVL